MKLDFPSSTRIGRWQLVERTNAVGRLACYSAMTGLFLARVGFAQITAVPPFAGTHSETWEQFGVRKLPNGTSILGGLATISCSEANMETAHSFVMCLVTGHPSDGSILMDSDRPSGEVTISFAQPISAFGAYWGSGFLCSFGDSPTLLTFYGANGQVIGTDSFGYGSLDRSGKLAWHGYSFATPVTKITRQAEDGEEGFAMDGVQITVAPATTGPGKLANVSTRSFVQVGDNVLIGGLIITGTGSKQVLLRALGPTLAGFNVPNELANPVLELHMPDGTVVTNDNWLEAANASSIPLNLRPSNGTESAILITLEPGAYTAIIRGVGDTTGNASVEVYDLAPESSARVANISTRSAVGTGDNIMIAGFIIVGDLPIRVLVRAIGPTLTNSGVAGPLADTTLELHDSNGTLLASNDDWESEQRQEIVDTTLAPTNAREAAILRTLQPGAYTAILRGKDNTSGVGLVEVYNLDD